MVRLNGLKQVISNNLSLIFPAITKMPFDTKPCRFNFSGYEPGHRNSMKQLARCIVAALALCFASHAQAEQVDLELVLAMDASGSISNAEYILQLEGTAAAFRDPAIQAAITSGPAGKIAVSVMLWSDAAFPKIKSGWFVLDSARSADTFSRLVETFQLSEDRTVDIGGGGTGIGAGVREAVDMLNTNTHQGLRRVIDVSGDGIETEFSFSKGIMVRDAKLIAQAEGITINGLPILSENFPALDEYYRDEVIAGPGAFVEKASGFEDFGRAIRRKLLREIQSQVAIAPRHDSRRIASNRP